MAWKDDLLQASFKGVIFDCLRIEDEANKAIAEHEYPYQSGADLEDMGMGARRVEIEAFFYGDHYKDDLVKFIGVCEAVGSGELVHPVFGSVKAAILRHYRIQHDED